MSPGDYLDVDVRLGFMVGDTISCRFVDISDDNICENEPNEFFNADILLRGSEGPINVVPSQSMVIIDDTNEPECGKLC